MRCRGCVGSSMVTVDACLWMGWLLNGRCGCVTVNGLALLLNRSQRVYLLLQRLLSKRVSQRILRREEALVNFCLIRSCLVHKWKKKNRKRRQVTRFCSLAFSFSV
ncbi:hypothetical protein IGI04_029689 [Brassica rapa subsp. trilocularis]|uniref:Secreted protein n=1 Tax=Brassica rapa subsp. trilocularis TaxID=1813537 RepID=A0ABQ7LNK4_BRACM|nr:hypothetical protein IGI04_029689 [Brassica rapa subsp. trilocularis]